MFTKLKENIGTYIICTYWKNEQLKTEILKLDRVDDYQSIYNENYIWIHFLTYDECIISIESLTGEVLYENKYFIDEYKSTSDKEELTKRELLVFGKEYIAMKEKHKLLITGQQNLKKDQKERIALLTKGLFQIDISKKDDWTIFVATEPNLKIIEATISMLEQLNQEISDYHTETYAFAKEFIVSGEEMHKINKMASYFSQKDKSNDTHQNKYNSQIKIRKKKVNNH